MLPVHHIMSLGLLVIAALCAVYIVKTGALTQKARNTWAIALVGCCALYVTGGWIVRHFYYPNYTDNIDCVFNLFGNVKKVNGVLHGGCIDVWHVFHVLFWCIVGILAPGNYSLVLITAVTWETLEHLVFKYVSKRCTSPFCGRVEDIVLNLCGYVAGSLLAGSLAL